MSLDPVRRETRHAIKQFSDAQQQVREIDEKIKEIEEGVEADDYRKYLTSHREIKLLINRRQRAFVFATGASQFAILKALTGIAGLPWNRIVGFHLDEYVEISGRTSFRRYLRERLTSLVPPRRFFENRWRCPGSGSGVQRICPEASSGQSPDMFGWHRRKRSPCLQ